MIGFNNDLCFNYNHLLPCKEGLTAFPVSLKTQLYPRWLILGTRYSPRFNSIRSVDWDRAWWVKLALLSYRLCDRCSKLSTPLPFSPAGFLLELWFLSSVVVIRSGGSWGFLQLQEMVNLEWPKPNTLIPMAAFSGIDLDKCQRQGFG